MNLNPQGESSGFKEGKEEIVCTKDEQDAIEMVDPSKMRSAMVDVDLGDGQKKPAEGGSEKARKAGDGGWDAKDEKTEAAEVEMIDGRPRDVYDRFTKNQKRRIVAIISFSAFIAPMTSSIFLPSIPYLAQDLHTTAEVVNYTVAIFIVTIGVAPVLWSPYAGFYGRKPIYLASMPIMVVASIGVSQCKNVGAIIGTRILQGIGSSCFLSVGAGSIGDIFRPTERSRGMSAFYMGVLVGPALSPVIAGIFTEYTSPTWRTSQYFLAGCGALSVLLTFFFLPETAHPPLPHDILKKERGKKFVWFTCNPLRSLGLVRWPNIAAACFISSCGMVVTYCFLVPLSTVFKERYGINNAALGGLLYIVNGAGNIIGSRFVGPYADRVTKKAMEKRGYRRPEDRLRAAIWGMAVIMPVSCLVYGWVLQSGKGGMAPPLVMLFLNGFALMLANTPVNTYLVDSMQSRSAEVVAINNCIRYIFAAAASAFVLPLANAIGWGLTMTICAIISWMAFAALWFVYRYGDNWRHRANLRYGITEDEAEEERVDGGQDEEAAVHPDSRVERRDSAQTAVTVGSQRTGESAEEEGRHDQHGELTRTFTKGKGKRRDPGVAVLERRRSMKGEMPAVGDVLKRTVSLSGASVHGG
ncbi:hypothetical protein IAT38_008179 [Cryptococcus sp. DSM 104549]